MRAVQDYSFDVNCSFVFLASAGKELQRLAEHRGISLGRFAIAHQCRFVGEVELKNTRQKARFAGSAANLVRTDAGQIEKTGQQFAVLCQEYQGVNRQSLRMFQIHLILHE